MNLDDYSPSAEAAHYLKYAESTLRISRVTGELGGREAPQYIRRGGRIFYKKSVLAAWLEKFTPQNNTSQNFEVK